MNKKLWVGIYVVSFLLLIAGLIIGIIVGSLFYDGVLRDNGSLPVVLIAVGAVIYLQFALVHTIYAFLMLARMWGSIQDGVTPITVGKAIGFLFIPFFNIYWMFVAWGGFPKHYNEYVDRHKLNVPQLSGGVYATLPIFTLLTAFLWLPVVALPFIFTALIARTCDAVNQLKQAEADSTNPVQQSTWQEQAPKTKLVFAALTGLAAVLFLFLTAFGVFAFWNLNPRAKADEVPETVGKFKKNRLFTLGSIIGVRDYFSADYEPTDGPTKKDEISYVLESYLRESDAVSDFQRESRYCSGKSTKQEGAIKDKSGNQVGDFLICNDANLTSRIGKKNITIKGNYTTPYRSADFIKFFTELPFAATIDPSSFSGVKSTPASLPPPTNNPKTTVAATDTADFVLTAEEFSKERDPGVNNAKTKEKYADKIVEISGRVYTLYPGSGDVGLLTAASPVSLKIANESRAEADKLKTDERVIFKCRSGGSYRIELKSCLLTESKGIISPDEKPDFTFTAKDFFKEVDGTQSVESASKKQKKYASKIIEVTGRVQIIIGKPHYLFVADSDWVSCKPDEENAGQFANLREGQEVKFKGLGSRYGAGLEHCIVISQ